MRQGSQRSCDVRQFNAGKGRYRSDDQALTAIKDSTLPLLLILVSNGGEPGSAHLIGQLCRESSQGKFTVAVPRHAKSAATLLSCAADEIHMGSLSELGPIDPQFNGMPALGLKNSIEHIAELVTRVPGSAELFARYLKDSIEPIQIGYYERVAESAVQYADRLLSSHQKTPATPPPDIAFKLVYGYKDHGFVIDKTEATAIFGPDTIKTGTTEYHFANAIYSSLGSHGFFTGRASLVREGDQPRRSFRPCRDVDGQRLSFSRCARGSAD